MAQPGDRSDDAETAADLGDHDSPPSRKTSRRLLKFVGILVVLALLYYSLFVLLPSELDWDTVWADLQALSAWQIGALVGSGLLAIVALGWTSKASLPGLTLYQGTESSATPVERVRVPAACGHGHPLRDVPDIRLLG